MDRIDSVRLYMYLCALYLAFLCIEYRISSIIRQRFFPPKQSKNLDPSYKMDLDLWDCLGKIKLIL